MMNPPLTKGPIPGNVPAARPMPVPFPPPEFQAYLGLVRGVFGLCEGLCTEAAHGHWSPQHTELWQGVLELAHRAGLVGEPSSPPTIVGDRSVPRPIPGDQTFPNGLEALHAFMARAR